MVMAQGGGLPVRDAVDPAMQAACCGLIQASVVLALLDLCHGFAPASVLLLQTL